MSIIRDLRRDNVISRTCNSGNGLELGSLSTGSGHSSGSSFKSGNALFKDVYGRVCNAMGRLGPSFSALRCPYKDYLPRINVSKCPQPKEIGGMLRIVKDKAGRGIDGHGSSIRRRIGSVAGMELKSIKLGCPGES